MALPPKSRVATMNLLMEMAGAWTPPLAKKAGLPVN
jgi:hypothetical protein